MNVALLDTQDANLQLWQGGQALTSPGYAWLDGKDYQFGQAARASARLHPRSINTRYWWQLSVEPLQPSLGPARHTADLVHAHLKQLHAEGGQPGELLLAVSGSASRDQLALLLGIVQQCPFDAVGLVNRSVALASAHPGSGRLFHLEIQLHQALLTELSREGGEVSVARSTPIPGCGLLQLQERLVEQVAATFIRQTRFDPRRKAETEQQLYDALPRALAALAKGPEAFIEVQGYRTRVTGEELDTAAQRLVSALKGSLGDYQADDHIIVDPLGGLLPGLLRELPQTTLLGPDALFQAAGQHSDALINRGEALSLVSRLPLAEAPITPVSLEPAAPEPAPEPMPEPASHILVGHRALPLVDGSLALAEGCEIVKNGQGWYLAGSAATGATVNGQPAADRPLGLGDRIQLGSGDELLLIEVSQPE